MPQSPALPWTEAWIRRAPPMKSRGPSKRLPSIMREVKVRGSEVIVPGRVPLKSFPESSRATSSGILPNTSGSDPLILQSMQPQATTAARNKWHLCQGGYLLFPSSSSLRALRRLSWGGMVPVKLL